MQAMGDKNAARACARKAGVPVTPGSDGIVETESEAIRIAKRIGYPVMIKAAAGGGGHGMRMAHNEPSLKSAFHSARHEAQKAFGNEQVYLEKLIHNPHHIELDRKSTRLNSSHTVISYAVFCLKKKKSSIITIADCLELRIM